MAITRLNVYAGLVGLYQIVDPDLSSDEDKISVSYTHLDVYKRQRHFLVAPSPGSLTPFGTFLA